MTGAMTGTWLKIGQRLVLILSLFPARVVSHQRFQPVESVAS